MQNVQLYLMVIPANNMQRLRFAMTFSYFVVQRYFEDPFLAQLREKWSGNITEMNINQDIFRICRRRTCF